MYEYIHIYTHTQAVNDSGVQGLRGHIGSKAMYSFFEFPGYNKCSYKLLVFAIIAITTTPISLANYYQKLLVPHVARVMFEHRKFQGRTCGSS